MRKHSLRLLLAGALFLAAPAAAAASPADPHADVLDMRGTPAAADDRGFNIFFDAGAWHGYSLPAAGDAGSGFSGPFAHSIGMGRWAGRRVARVVLKEAGSGDAIALRETASHAAPGYLQRQFEGGGLSLRQTLFFADARRALVRIELQSAADRTLDIALEGDAMLAEGDRIAPQSGMLVQTFAKSREALRTRLTGDAGQLRITQDAGGYRFASAAPLRLRAGQPLTLVLEQALLPDAGVALADVDANAAWTANRARWDEIGRAHV